LWCDAVQLQTDKSMKGSPILCPKNFKIKDISKAGKGFTLIEILVAVTIIGLIFSIGYVSFREYSRRQTVVSVTRAIKSDIRLAQQNAISGKKPAGCVTDLDAYSASFSEANNSYTVGAVCGGITIEEKTVELPSGVTMTAPSINPLIFYSVGRGTNIAVGGIIITISQPASSYSQTVEMGPGGEIK